MVSDHQARADKHELRIARAWKRVAAFLIDVVVVGALATLRWLVPGLFSAIAIVIVPPVYFWLATSMKDGRTVGKLAVGIEVITTILDKPSLGRTFWREVVGKFVLPPLIAFPISIATIIIDGSVFDGLAQPEMIEECVDFCLSTPRALYTGLYVGLASIPLVPIVFMLVDRRNRSLHDILFGTLVVRRHEPVFEMPKG